MRRDERRVETGGGDGWSAGRGWVAFIFFAGSGGCFGIAACGSRGREGLGASVRGGDAGEGREGRRVGPGREEVPIRERGASPRGDVAVTIENEILRSCSVAPIGRADEEPRRRGEGGHRGAEETSSRASSVEVVSSCCAPSPLRRRPRRRVSSSASDDDRARTPARSSLERPRGFGATSPRASVSRGSALAGRPSCRIAPPTPRTTSPPSRTPPPSHPRAASPPSPPSPRLRRPRLRPPLSPRPPLPRPRASYPTPTLCAPSRRRSACT